MQSYRLYCLDGAGKISFAEELKAQTDEGAIAEARDRKRNALNSEVWHGSRLVATLEAHDLSD
jgi:hypothetical protein